MKSTQRLLSSERSFVDGLNDSIRENPVGASLIGIGVLWMLLGRRRLASIGGAIPSALSTAAGSVGAAVAAGGSSVAGGVKAAGAHIGEASERIKEGVSDALTTPAEGSYYRSAENGDGNSSLSMTSAAKSVGETARTYTHSGLEYGRSLKDQLGASLERQPLLLGALGVAIGAGIASAFPSTHLENEFMGKQSSAAREKVQAATADLKNYATTTAKHVMDDVKQEARTQGLTPSAVKETLHGVADKAKNVAESVKGSVSNRV